MNQFYVDTCIWLNLFKKEGDYSKGVPYWQIAKTFFEKILYSDNVIIVSPIILRELEFKLKDKYFLVKEVFKNVKNIRFIKITPEDYDFARKLESDSNYSLSFYDYLHIAICKRLNLNLITRDEDLIKIADKYVSTNKPEELIY